MSVVTIVFLSLKYELFSQYRMPNALIDVMSSNDAFHSVLFHNLDTFNAQNARTRLMAPPSMSKPFLVSAHSLLSAYLLAVHSYKRMRLTTSVYDIPQYMHTSAEYNYISSSVIVLYILVARHQTLTSDMPTITSILHDCTMCMFRNQFYIISI